MVWVGRALLGYFLGREQGVGPRADRDIRRRPQPSRLAARPDLADHRGQRRRLEDQPLLPQCRGDDRLGVVGEPLATGGAFAGQQRRNRPLASISRQQRINPPCRQPQFSCRAGHRHPARSRGVQHLVQFAGDPPGAQPIHIVGWTHCRCSARDARVEVPQEIVPGLKFLGKRAVRIPGEAEEIVTFQLVEVLNQNRHSHPITRARARPRRPAHTSAHRRS